MSILLKLILWDTWTWCKLLYLIQS
jgi:hypothetical protein